MERSRIAWKRTWTLKKRLRLRNHWNRCANSREPLLRKWCTGIAKEARMPKRFQISLGAALLLALVITIPVFAGGWAVITLDELPVDVVAGEPLTIGFTVRQHGITLMDGLYPTVTARLPKGDSFLVNAEPDGTPGHYTATLTFPQEGDWEWAIQAFTMHQPMPVLHVAA